MNCANHTDVSAVAYCRTCGKPLCAQCTRDVRGVIYCENCLAARMENVQPPAMPAAPVYSQAAVPLAAQGGPNPAVAGILAGFFPFGVGAVYTSQYAKGLAHLVIAVLLIVGASEGGLLSVFCGLAIRLSTRSVPPTQYLKGGLPPIHLASRKRLALAKR